MDNTLKPVSYIEQM